MTDKVIYHSDDIKYSTKTCAECGELKPINCFYNDKRNKDGKQSRCKKCMSAKSREWEKTTGLLKWQKKNKKAGYNLLEKVTSNQVYNKSVAKTGCKIIRISDDQYLVQWPEGSFDNKGAWEKRYMNYISVLKYCKRIGLKFQPIEC